MQLLIISVAFLASVAACSVNFFTTEQDRVKNEKVSLSEVNNIDPGVSDFHNGEPE